MAGPEHEEDDFAAFTDRLPELDREQAFAVLLGASAFASGGVNNGDGSVPQTLLAFDTLLRQPDGAAAFRDLLRRATTAGQVYALCGLYLTDRAAFEAEWPAYRDRADPVECRQGCLSGTTAMGRMVFNPDPDVVRLQPGQGLREAIGSSAFSVDVAGGGLPVSIREFIAYRIYANEPGG